MPKGKIITVFGVTYSSFTAACSAFGFAAPAVRHRMKTEGLALEAALTRKSRYSDAKKHPNYGPWNAMRGRCYSKGRQNTSNARYQAKGITVCDEWRNDFWTFVKDMGVRPSKRHTIDRIDNLKGYEIGNCRWATMKEQGRNRTDNRPCGPFPTFIDASEATGIAPTTLRYRILKRGMSFEDAVAASTHTGNHDE